MITKFLQKKLFSYGIRGHILKWIESYLTDRYQYVIYNGVQSNYLRITCGVLQGSILGPLLFIIYINDIWNLSHLFPILYADDTSVLVNNENIHKLLEILNNELNKLSTWLKSNILSLNVNKTHYILFHRARINLPDAFLNVYMSNSRLTHVECCKYLGVILDSKMSWVQHITYVKKTFSKGIGIMYQARKYSNEKSLVGLYHSYIYPYLIYCVESWGNVAKCHLDSLFILQKKIIRIITFSSYDKSSQFLFTELNILPLCNLIQNIIGFMMYKLVNGLLPDVMNELYTTILIKDHVYASSFRNIST